MSACWKPCHLDAARATRIPRPDGRGHVHRRRWHGNVSPRSPGRQRVGTCIDHGKGELVTCSETTQPACLHPRWPGKAGGRTQAFRYHRRRCVFFTTRQEYTNRHWRTTCIKDHFSVYKTSALGRGSTASSTPSGQSLPKRDILLEAATARRFAAIAEHANEARSYECVRHGGAAPGIRRQPFR